MAKSVIVEHCERWCREFRKRYGYVPTTMWVDVDVYSEMWDAARKDAFRNADTLRCGSIRVYQR